MIKIIVSFVLGAWFGLFVTSLNITSSQSDRCMECIMNKEKEKEINDVDGDI